MHNGCFPKQVTVTEGEARGYHDLMRVTNLKSPYNQDDRLCIIPQLHNTCILPIIPFQHEINLVFSWKVKHLRRTFVYHVVRR